jgi:hypothetical protein
MKLNTFQNNKNNYYSTILLFRKGDKITNIFLNSLLLFQTWSPNNIFTIQNNIILLLSSRQLRNHYFFTLLINYSHIFYSLHDQNIEH